MRLPEKEYYSLKKVADQWKCSIEDLLYFGETGQLKMCVVLPPTHVKRLNMQKLEKNVESLELSLKGKCLPVKSVPEALSVLNPLMENAMVSFSISSGIYLLSRKSIIDIRRGEGIMPVKSLNNDILYYFCDEKSSQHNILGLSKRKFEITDLVITHKEKLRFEKECGSDKPLPKPKQSVDEFVRSLTIYPENNDTINIQIPGKKAEPFTGPTLGFHKEGGDEWELLKKIIQEGRYYIGSTKFKEGDANRKRLTRVNKKMIKFLNENFNARIPAKYKLFEKSVKDEKGTRKPKFKTQPAGRYSNFTKEQLFEKLKAECSKLEKLKIEYSKDEADSEIIQEIIQDLVVAAREKGISNDDIKSVIPLGYKPALLSLINEEVYKKEEGIHITNRP